jgi:hypothetical protein
VWRAQYGHRAAKTCPSVRPRQPFIHSFIHSFGMCRLRQFLAILRCFFHSSLLCTLFFHPFPPTSFTSSFTLSFPSIFWSTSQPCCFQIHLNNTFLGIIFYSILCTCPNQRKLFKHIVSVTVGLLTPRLPCPKLFKDFDKEDVI